MLKKIRMVFLKASCLVFKDAPLRARSMFLTDNNELSLSHTFLFGKTALDISANTLTFNRTMNDIISSN